MLEKNTHIIEFAYYTSPDGTQLALFGGKRVILGWQDIGMPQLNYLTSRGPFQHGVTVRDFRLEPRVINITLYEKGCERQDFWCNEANLVSILRPNRSSTVQPGILLLVRPDNVEIEIPVHILEGPSGSWDGQGTLHVEDLQETLRFFCPDPVWRLPTQGTTSFTITADDSCLDNCLPFCLDGSLINASSVIAYLGTWDGDTLTIAITGPLLSPIIKNATTNQEIKFNYNIASGETVTISISPNLTTVTNNFGTNLIGTIDNISDLVTFFLATISDLTTTGNNTITVIGAGGVTGTTNITISYFIRHISAFVPC